MRRRRAALAIPALALAVVALLGGCMGIDVGSVRRADAATAGSAALAPDQALAQGQIRFVVDGQPLQYGLLNKPTLQLFHRGRAQLLSTPEVGNDGSFRWQLPAGDYGVAVIHGGMAPAGQWHRLPAGALVQVNGIVDPGLEFKLEPGRTHALGTLVVEVESAPMKDVLFGSERVFGRLRGIRVEGADAGLRVAARPAAQR